MPAVGQFRRQRYAAGERGQFSLHQRFFCTLTASSDRMLLVCAHPSMLQWAAAYFGDKRVVAWTRRST
jgi:hypothetical protein